jgi:hypothetical protein
VNFGQQPVLARTSFHLERNMDHCNGFHFPEADVPPEATSCTPCKN